MYFHISETGNFLKYEQIFYFLEINDCYFDAINILINDNKNDFKCIVNNFLDKKDHLVNIVKINFNPVYHMTSRLGAI